MKKLILLLMILFTANTAYAATRFYLASNEATGTVTPDFGGGNAWTYTTGANRRLCDPVKKSSTWESKATNSSSSNGTYLNRQYISYPIVAQSIIGNVSGLVRGLTSSTGNSNQSTPEVNIFLVSNDGKTVRGNILNHRDSSSTYASTTTLTSKWTPAQLSGIDYVQAQDGDRIVIEIGMNHYQSGGGARTTTQQFGDSASSDLTVEGSTLQYNPWIEFDMNIMFTRPSVIKPNGTEWLKSGTSYTIQYNITPDATSVTIKLSTNEGASWGTTLTTEAWTHSGLCTYEWTTVPSLISNQCRISVEAISHGMTARAISATNFTISTNSQSTEVWISTTGSDTTGNGTIGSPYRTIANAIRAASAGGIVKAFGGTYNENNILWPNTNNITLKASIETSPVTIDAQGAALFTVPSAVNLTVEGITMLNGHDGNIYIGAAFTLSKSNTTLWLIDSTIQNCTADADSYGAIIYCKDNTDNIYIQNCIFQNNSVRRAQFLSGTYNITNSDFKNNLGPLVDGENYSGAPTGYSNWPTLTITGSTIEGNQPSSISGYGWLIMRATVNANKSYIKDSTFNGSGTLFYDTTLTGTNCVFSNNNASSTGQGLFSNGYSDVVNLYNCTLYKNLNNGTNGSINAGANFTATNSIFYANTDPCFNPSNPSVTYSDIQPNSYLSGTGNISAEPAFASTTEGNADYLRLTSGSPCKDTGTSEEAPTDDLAGVLRPQPYPSGGYDMGAYEYSDTTAPVVTVEAPDGGEIWEIDTTHNITWTATDDTGIDHINIYYTTNEGASWIKIATGESNDGTYPNWTSSIPEDGYKIRIQAVDTSGNMATDESDATFSFYTIGNAQGCLLWNKLDSNSSAQYSEIGPDGTLGPGDISYEAVKFSNGAMARLGSTGWNDYVHYGDGDDLIDKTKGCIEFWIKPKFGLTGGYASDSIDHSFIFERGDVAIEIAVRWGEGLTFFYHYDMNYIYCYSDVSWAADDILHVACVWSTEHFDTDKHSAIYVNGKMVGSSTAALDMNFTLNNFYVGVQPNDHYPSHTHIDNIKVWNRAKTDFSDRFYEGFETHLPTVEVLTPSATGITLEGGSTYEVTWTATDESGITNICIRYSSGESYGWIDISTNEANDGSYIWTVPEINSTTCKISIEATDNTGLKAHDDSDNDFEIEYVAPPAGTDHAVTRFYLPSTGAAEVSPSFSVWTNTTGADRVRCVTKQVYSSFATKGTDTAADAGTYLNRQYVSDPIAGQTISGYVSGEVRGAYSGTVSDVSSEVIIKIVSNDGQTLRGTLLDFTFGTANYDTSLKSYWIPQCTAVTPVAAQNGDRIVIEIGGSRSTGSSSPTINQEFGDSSAANEVEGSTTQGNPWIGFSQDIRLPSITVIGQ